MLVREYLYIVVESAYGTPKASPTAGVDDIWIRLDEGNNFTMEPVPVTVDIPHGAGLALKCDTVSAKTELKGTLKVKLCYSQAAILLGMGLVPMDSTPLPWASTEPIGDLASVSIYHAVYQDDTGTFARTKFNGVKNTGGKLDVSEESQIMQLSLDLQGSTYFPNPVTTTAITTTEFPATAAETLFPTDYVLFEHSGGGVTINTTVRALYWNLSHSWTNKCEAMYFANKYVQRIRMYGRDLTLDSEIMLVGTPDDLTPYRAVTGFGVTVIYTDTTNTLTFAYQSSNIISKLPFDLQNEKSYRRKMSIENRFDKTAGVDFALTVA